MNRQRTLKQTARLAVCFSLLLSAGCSVGVEPINKAAKDCKENGGLEKLHWQGPWDLVAYCKNGAEFKLESR